MIRKRSKHESHGGMDLTTLKLFVQVCDTQSIKRVAEREGIDASSITKRLAKLEDQLQISLLKRVRHGLHPTPEGALFCEQVRQLVLDSERIELDWTRDKNGFSGALTVAANSSNAASVLIDDLSAFLALKEQNNVNLIVKEMVSKDVVQAVRDGRASMGVIWDNTETAGLQQVPYHRDQISAVMHVGHPLSQRTEIAFEEVIQHDLVAMKYTKHSEALIRRTGALPNRQIKYKVETDSWESALRMSAHGFGILVCPAKMANLYAINWNLAVIPITDSWAHQLIKIIYKNNLINKLEKHLIEHLVSQHASSTQK